VTGNGLDRWEWCYPHEHWSSTEELLSLLEANSMGESAEAEYLKERLAEFPEVFEITATVYREYY